MPHNASHHRTSVLISLYNYGLYITESIESVLAQTVQADEIIVVDDGSTDEGPQHVKELAAKHPSVKLVSHSNSGQLSSLQKAYEESSGEILFFLDADDIWKPDHIEHFLKAFDEQPHVDHVFTGYRKFGKQDGRYKPYRQSLHLGKNVISTFYSRSYVGSITSSNALRRHIVEKLFPAPDRYKELCRINGDAWIILGNSMLGGVSYYLDSDTTLYRIHEQNNFHGTDQIATNRYSLTLKLRQIVEYFAKQQDFSDKVRFDFHREFMTTPRPDRRCYQKARKILELLDLPLRLHWQMHMRLRKHYRKNRLD